MTALLAREPKPDLVTPLHASTGGPLLYATRRGNADIVKALSNAGAVAADPAELLLAAVESGNVALLAPLLARRAPGVPPSPQVLSVAVNNANAAIVYALLAAGADANSTAVNGVPPLGTVALLARSAPSVARPEHVAVVYALLGSGANPDTYVSVLYATPKAYALRNSPALAAAVGWR